MQLQQIISMLTFVPVTLAHSHEITEIDKELRQTVIRGSMTTSKIPINHKQTNCWTAQLSVNMNILLVIK